MLASFGATITKTASYDTVRIWTIQDSSYLIVAARYQLAISLFRSGDMGGLLVAGLIEDYKLEELRSMPVKMIAKICECFRSLSRD